MCNHYRNDFRKDLPVVGMPYDDEYRQSRIRFDNLQIDVYPDRVAMVGRRDSVGGLEFVQMRWGFPPPEGEKRLRNNTRRLHLPFWRPWLEPQNRCLIPFTSFAEWVEGSDGKSVEAWFAPANGQVGFVAGIWRSWTGTRGPKAEQVTGDHLVFSFLTSEPNKVVGRIHDRMPAILPDQAAQEAWLTAPASAAKSFQKPVDDDWLVRLDPQTE